MHRYRIYPLKTGTIVVDRGAYVTRGIGLGQEMEIPGTAWYVTDGFRKIMVDAGMCPTELADWHHKGSRQEPGEAVHERLQALGVDPADIDLVILTHLHWDHCHNLDKFTTARFVVHARELAFARDPIPPYFKSYEHPRLGKTPPFAKISFEPLTDEVELVPGITVFPTPGHSPGHQSVAVATEGDVHVITGDAVFSYANLVPANETQPFTVMGRFSNIVDSWHSMEEIVRRGKVILPGHDMRTMDYPVYPAGTKI